MKKDKLFAPFLMLFAGAIAYLSMLAFGYRFQDAVVILLIVLVVFYIIGLLIQKQVNKFIRENEEKEREEAEKEGAVIEKEAPPDEENSTETEGGLPPLTGARPAPETAEEGASETEDVATDAG